MTEDPQTLPKAVSQDGRVRTVSQSSCVMNEIVLPNDTNNLGNMMGGRLLHLMDICAAISAQRHTNRVCVTASVDHVEFQSPIYQGEIVTLRSRVNRAFNTSMEVEINVWAENARENTVRKCNRAFYTFVAVDDANRPVPVPPIVPESEAEERCYANAAKRREVRLILSGRLNWGDTRHIKEDLLAALTER